jgi:hypothetical protein
MILNILRGLASMEPLDRARYRLLLEPLEDEVQLCMQHFEDVIVPIFQRQHRLDNTDING